jgi:BTB And C-terminal Kelch/Kelch motif
MLRKQVSQGEEFLALEPERLFEILSSNELNVDHEELVFDALMRWVQFKEDKRAQHIAKLLPAIRFGLLSSRFIREHVLDNRLIAEHGRQILRDTEGQIMACLEDYRSASTSLSMRPSVMSTLRSGMIKPEHCIVLVGGADDSHPSINCYNPLTRETYYIADVSNESRTGYYTIVKPACVVTDDNQLYLAGGSYMFHELNGDGADGACDEDSFDDYDDDVVGKNFYLYDGDRNRWIPRASMLFPKSNFALACVGGKIYCFGGLSINQHPSEIVECYDVAANQWKYTGMMPTTLVDLTAVTYNQSVFIFGGRTGVTVHDSALRYEPRRSEWTTLAAMRTPRFNCGACCVNGEIYVVGGQIYSHVGHTINRLSLRNVDIYSVERDRWRPGPPLPDPVYNVGAMVIDGALFVCGTLEHHRIAYRVYRCNVVYRLDLARAVWTRVESDLCTLRDFACVTARMHTRRLSQVFRPEVDT